MTSAAAQLEAAEQAVAGVEPAVGGGRREVVGDQPRAAVEVGPVEDELLARAGDRRRLGEDLPGPDVADDSVVLGGDDDEQGLRGDPGQARLAARLDLARHQRDDGAGLRQAVLRGHRRHLRREVAAGRVADQREPAAIGPDVRRRRLEHVEGVADRGQRVGQEVGRAG